MSGMQDDKVDAIIAERGLPGFTKNTITSRERLIEELSRIRMLGYSIDNEEFEFGIRCIAAPVFDGNNQVVAAISISGPFSDLERK